MEKDKRYETVRVLILSEKITSFQGIFSILPVEIVARDINVPVFRLSTLLTTPECIPLREIIKVGHLIEIDEQIILALTYNDYVRGKYRYN